MKAHELVSEIFLAEGVDTVFTLMGDANMHWLDGIVARPSVRVVHARHEGAALAMADGWAQSTGQVGICSVTCGPGTTNIVTSLRVAAHHRTPLVVLAGDTPLSSPTHLQAFDVGSLKVLTGVEVVEIRSEETVAAQVRAAFGTARRELCPVVLSLPYDLAQAEINSDVRTYAPLPARPGPGHASPSEVDMVCARLKDADDVLLLVGRGAVASGALEGIERLAEHFGAITGTTVKALGALRHRSRDVGVIGGFTPLADHGAITSCDVVLALGASLSYLTTLDGSLIDPERTIQVVDRADAWDPDYVFEPSKQVVADCRDLVDQLLQALKAEGASLELAERRLVPTELPSGLPPGEAASEGLDPVAALATIRRALNRPVQLVLGVGHFWNLIVEMPEPFPPEGMQMHYGFGSIAQALPAGLGAAVAEPNLPTVVIEGDGSLMMTVQELETAARSGVVMLVLIMNDGAYGAEFHKLAAHGMHQQESIFGFLDLAGVAEAFGCRASTPQSLDELGKTVAEFLREPTLTVVDVRITRQVVSARHRANYSALPAKGAQVAR